MQVTSGNLQFAREITSSNDILQVASDTLQVTSDILQDTSETLQFLGNALQATNLTTSYNSYFKFRQKITCKKLEVTSDTMGCKSKFQVTI